MKKQYLEIAKQASACEQKNHWEEASKLWMQAIELGLGRDKNWAIVRFEFCCKRLGVRPLAFLNTEKQWLKLLSK
jgi:hypothetical protein